MSATPKDGDKRTVKGFTWVWEDYDDPGASVQGGRWRLIWPGKTAFHVKDYGDYGRGASPFEGCVLGSGGPFLSAGRYRTLDEALEGVAAYLRETLETLVAHTETELAELRTALADAEDAA